MPYYEQPAAVRESQVWGYFCPARRRPVQLSISGDVTTGGQFKLAHYAGGLGDYGCAPTSDNAAKPWMSNEADGALIVGEVLQKDGNKIVRWRSQTKLEMMERGLAYTILLGEKHVRPDSFGDAALGDGSIYNGDYPASFARLIDKDYPVAAGPTDKFNSNFGSWHSGVCQFLMADGGLRDFTNDVSPLVVQSLIPRGKNESAFGNSEISEPRTLMVGQTFLSALAYGRQECLPHQIRALAYFVRGSEFLVSQCASG